MINEMITRGRDIDQTSRYSILPYIAIIYLNFNHVKNALPQIQCVILKNECVKKKRTRFFSECVILKISA